MRAGQRLSPDELRQAAADAVKESGKLQRKVADELGVSKGAVSRALNETNSALAGLQRRIIRHLTGYRVEEEVTVTYVIRSKEENG